MDNIDKIKKFDLNLLAVFIAIDDQRHITKAAKVLGITQPALSHALGRLRLALKDPLFVKSSKGMVPTPRAEQLSLPIRHLLTNFTKDVLGHEKFNSKTMERVFRVYTTDLIESLLFPSLLRTIRIESPNTQVVSRSMPFSLPREDLERGICDIAVAGFFGDLPDGFYQQKLFSDSFACAVRKDHPRLKGVSQLSLDEFCEETHILVAPGGELHGKIDDLLKQKKRKRHVIAGLNAFMSAAWIIRETDSIFTGPTRLIKQMNQAFPINMLPLPIKLPNITIVQVWHERNNQDPGHRWFREQIRRTLQE